LLTASGKRGRASYEKLAYTLETATERCGDPAETRPSTTTTKKGGRETNPHRTQLILWWGSAKLSMVRRLVRKEYRDD